MTLKQKFISFYVAVFCFALIFNIAFCEKPQDFEILRNDNTNQANFAMRPQEKPFSVPNVVNRKVGSHNDMNGDYNSLISDVIGKRSQFGFYPFNWMPLLSSSPFSWLPSIFRSVEKQRFHPDSSVIKVSSRPHGVSIIGISFGSNHDSQNAGKSWDKTAHNHNTISLNKDTGKFEFYNPSSFIQKLLQIKRLPNENKGVYMQNVLSSTETEVEKPLVTEEIVAKLDESTKAEAKSDTDKNPQIKDFYSEEIINKESIPLIAGSAIIKDKPENVNNDKIKNGKKDISLKENTNKKGLLPVNSGFHSPDLMTKDNVKYAMEELLMGKTNTRKEPNNLVEKLSLNRSNVEKNEATSVESERNIDNRQKDSKGLDVVKNMQISIRQRKAVELQKTNKQKINTQRQAKRYVNQRDVRQIATPSNQVHHSEQKDNQKKENADVHKGTSTVQGAANKKQEEQGNNKSASAIDVKVYEHEDEGYAMGGETHGLLGNHTHSKHHWSRETTNALVFLCLLLMMLCLMIAMVAQSNCSSSAQRSNSNIALHPRTVTTASYV